MLLPAGGVANLTRVEALSLCQLGASCWLDTLRGQRHAHLKPYSRKTVMFHAYHGHSYEALTRVLQTVWSEFLSGNGLADNDCPIYGLFP